MKKKKEVRVGKIDLDTVGTAFLLGVTRADKVEVLRDGKASPEDLADPSVICIEVGGSGQVQLNNWDHHGEKELRSATFQAYTWRMSQLEEPTISPKLCLLVDYIDLIDTKGPQVLRNVKVEFPTLSEVFSGMLLTIRDPVEQLHRGVEILREVLNARIFPLGRMPIKGRKYRDWAVYAKAKTENNRQVAEAVKEAWWAATRSGLKLAWLETDFFGAPGALYGVGAQVVVAFSPHFGPNKIPKFTVAGNGIRIDGILAELNTREPGWGGPGSGTIIGSPREGSRMTLDEVVEIVKKVL